jgi:O-antigen/teichoic acid export membrane protein
MQVVARLQDVHQTIFRAVAGRQFFRNVLVVLTGTALAQVITIMSSPIVSRLFSPEAFGALGTFMSLLGLAGPLATLTYSTAIVLPRHEEASAALVSLSLIISAAISITSIFVVFTYNIIDGESWAGSVRGLLYLMPLVIMFEGLFQVAQQCMIRLGRYRQSAYLNVIQALVSGVAKIVAGLLAPNAFSLVLVSLLAVPINAALFALALSNNRTSRWPVLVPLSEIKAVALRYSDFPLYKAPQSLVGTFALSLPILVLAYLHGSAAAGFFTLCNSVLGAPTLLLTKTINDVFFPRLVDAAHRGEDVAMLILKTAGALGAISIVPTLVLVLVGPELFRMVFGAQWSQAGEYSRWLSLLTCTTLVLRAALTATPILNLQGTYLFFEIASTLLKLAALSISMFGAFSPLVSVAPYAIVGSIANVLFFWYVIAQARHLCRQGALQAG